MRIFAALLFAVAASAADPEIATTVAFTEGPTVDADGNVYFTETTFQRIMKLSKDGALTVFRENSNGANGLILDAQGRLVVCEGGSRRTGGRPRVTRTDLKTGRTEVLADNFEGIPLNQPNDVTFDAKGRIYFTDFPGPNPVGVYRIDPDGKIARLLVAPHIEKPNGVAIAPDDKTLYLVEANGVEGGARMIRAYDLQPDGSVRNMRVFHNFYPGRSADGLCIDSKGNVYAAAGLHRRRGTHETLDTKTGVHVFEPNGKLLKFIPIPEDTITNCAFGGAEWKTLYVTAGKTLFKVQSDIPGTPR
ncbi:MAG: SMP-30/gluconolactonase/LRE family protein [Bryobacteraceae bacterium]